MSHKSPTSLVVTVVAALMVVAALTPQLVALSGALVPVLVVAALAAVLVRLVWFNTRRW